jgi:hypothetical protein
MRILFDQGVPAPLRRALTDHSVATAYEMGWTRLGNGALFARQTHSSTYSSPPTEIYGFNKILQAIGWHF